MGYHSAPVIRLQRIYARVFLVSALFRRLLFCLRRLLAVLVALAGGGGRQRRDDWSPAGGGDGDPLCRQPDGDGADQGGGPSAAGYSIALPAQPARLPWFLSQPLPLVADRSHPDCQLYLPDPDAGG